MNILSQVIENIKENVENNIKNYKLTSLLLPYCLSTFDNYINMVKCIDDINYNFSTSLYSGFIEEIDNAFFNSNYRKQFCEVINISERNIITLFGEVRFKRRYYFDKLKKEKYYYADKVLKLMPYSRFDPFVCAKVCEVSSHDSYAKAGRTVSELIGKRLKLYDDNNRYLINRATARKMVLDFPIPDIPYELRDNKKILYVMLDEKWVASQFNNGKSFMIKAAVIFEDVEEVYKYHKKEKTKIRYKLIGKHVIASIDNDIQKQVDDYIYNTYNVEELEEIVFMGDCAPWIIAFPAAFKYHKNLKITFSIDGFHFSQAIENICTKGYQDLTIILKDYCKSNDKDSFITVCNSLIQLNAERTDTITNKMNYILNNWDYVQAYYHKNPMKCCMESNISHCFADIFTARPRAYSKKGLRQLLKLRLLKVNNQDIQQIYFNVILNKYEEKVLFNSEFISYTKKFDGVYSFPNWLKHLIT